MPTPPTAVAGRQRTARRVRWWLGRKALDELLGGHDPAETVRVLLGNHPVVTRATVQDGVDLLADRLRDHPRGLPAERWGLWLARVRNVGVGVGIVGFLGVFIAGFVLSVGSPSEDPFEALAGRLNPGMEMLGVVLIGVPLCVGILLVWVLSAWRWVIVLAEVRYAIRWSARRPGQASRGVPVADPFVGLGGVLMALAVMAWILAAIALWFALFALSDGDVWPLIWLITLGLGLLGWGLLRGRRALREMAAVAGAHLLLFGHRGGGLRLDAATSVQDGFLLVTQDPLPFIRKSWSASEERVVYPLTAGLPAHEVARRHDQVRNDDKDLRLVGDGQTTPLVTLEVPGSGQDNNPGHSLDTSSYSGGWMVARTRWNRRPAVIIVQDQPERFRTEVLPAFGDRHGLNLDDIEWLEPQQIPESDRWLEEWMPPRT
ncbi:hypothetical protein [Tessaracoccus antarcticus]|uniref:Uncharacterized protein n=1 Tax=Tessaracoccus antarcticus TaxID=2479848 RepID=A0A3M0G8U9_9ACTN|nr:hypothetical protein [Tessaracoccus antarcticus]RMB61460.1 hypothetical protein EAX62_02085 [Tessaracoccus antarcticus]